MSKELKELTREQVKEVSSGHARIMCTCKYNCLLTYLVAQQGWRPGQSAYVYHTIVEHLPILISFHPQLHIFRSGSS